MTDRSEFRGSNTDPRVEPATGARSEMRGLPGWTYSSLELLDCEYVRIFRSSWQLLCHESDLPKCGSYFSLDLYRDSVFAVRSNDGDIRAFQNFCRHRGAKLLEGSGDCSRLIRCSYHGWTYDFDGVLRAVPAKTSFPGIDRAKLGLHQIDVEVFHGFVFVRIKGGGPSVAQMWGRYAADLEPYRFREMTPLAPVYREEWDVNWKVAVENNLESYHVPVSHPGLYRVVCSPTLEDSLSSGVARGINRLREKPSSRWSERAYQRHTAGVSGYLPKPDRKLLRFFSMLPNLAIDVYPELVRFLHVVPVEPRRCAIRVGDYALKSANREAHAVRYLNRRINRIVMREDRNICYRTQVGVSSCDYAPGPLSTQEQMVSDFHDMLREAVPAICQPIPPVASVS